MSVRPAASPLSNNDKPLPLPLPSPSPAAGATTTSRHSYTSKSSNSPSSAFQGLPSNLAMDNNTSSSSSLPAGRNSMGNLGTGTGAGGTGGLSPSSTSNNPPPNSNAARFRASVDAARTLYGTSSSSNNNNNGHQSLQPGSAAANSLSISSASNSPRPASGLGSKRPSSEMLASFAAGGAMNSESESSHFHNELYTVFLLHIVCSFDLSFNLSSSPIYPSRLARAKPVVPFHHVQIPSFLIWYNNNNNKHRRCFG